MAHRLTVPHRNISVAHGSRCATEILHFLWRIFGTCATESEDSVAHRGGCATENQLSVAHGAWCAIEYALSVAHQPPCATEK